MYRLRPPAVYAHESVMANPKYRSRLERVVAALENDITPIVYKDDDLSAMIGEKHIAAGRVQMGTLDEVPDPILLFNTFRFDGKRGERIDWLSRTCGIGDDHLAQALTGYGAFDWWGVKLGPDDINGTQICRPCWRVHFQNGCVHKCRYCGLGGLLVTMVNVEDYIEQFDRLMEAHPWQETFLLEDDAEVLCLEPELGCLGPLVEHFGTLDGKYLIIHAKSANVDWMLDLKHNGNTIIVWSVSGPTQAREIEPVAASTEERIEAARKAQEAGYIVRFKYKPIIPVRGWREECAGTTAAIFENTKPDLISLCSFMWTDIDQMLGEIDEDLLDPDAVAAAKAAANDATDPKCHPFPLKIRRELYEHHIAQIRKHSADVPISLSTESMDMWKVLGRQLGSTPTNYVCGCGPNSTPWRRSLSCHAFDVAAAGPQGGFDKS